CSRREQSTLNALRAGLEPPTPGLDELHDLRQEFLHRFGRETDQEVVVAELSGPEGSWFFRIKEYDEGGRKVWEASSRSRAVLRTRFVIPARRSVREDPTRS